MARRPRPTLLAIVLLPVLLAVSCSGGGGPTPSPVTPTRAVNATVAPLLPTTVDALPPTDVAGFHELLGQLKGTPVVVNVWGSWCDPCRSETPMLVAAARTHPGVQFLGVDVDDSRSGALGFLTTFNVPYPSLFDPTHAIRLDLGGIGTPDTYFYDANSTQVDAVIGILSQTSLDAGLAKIAPA